VPDAASSDSVTAGAPGACSAFEALTFGDGFELGNLGEWSVNVP
jgi:hypothetical protein